jgi:hypothetical protein
LKIYFINFFYVKGHACSKSQNQVLDEMNHELLTEKSIIYYLRNNQLQKKNSSRQDDYNYSFGKKENIYVSSNRPQQNYVNHYREKKQSRF